MNVLLDLDGTLCDPREGLEAGFRHALRALSLDDAVEGRFDALIGLPLLECFRRLGCGDRDVEGARHFKDFFLERGHAEAVVYDGVFTCLHGLKNAGRRLAIVSAKPQSMVERVAQDLKLAPLMDACFGCHEADLNPDKAVLVRRALEVLGWPAGRCVLVGDRSQDRDAARSAGLPFVAAAWGFGEPEEFAGARAVAARPVDLQAVLEGLEVEPRPQAL